MMSKLNDVSPKLLSDKGERALAKLARIARGDVYYGGCRALTLSKRLTRMGTSLDVDGVVSEVYTTDNGPSYLAYECPECGTVVAGMDNAYVHCADNEDDFEEEEPE